MRSPVDIWTTPLRLLARAAARRLASEAGFAVPTVMLMTVAALGMAGVAVTTSIHGQAGTVRDQGSKAALAVAESGVSQALLHYNRGVPPCVPAIEGEWCGPVAGMSVNGGEVAYWARIASGEECEVGNEVECVEIVAIGNVEGTTRRVNVLASTLSTEESTGGGPFATAGVLSLDSLTLDSNSTIHTGSATNGYLELKANARQCGPASVGIGKEMKPPTGAGYYSDVDCKAKGTTVLQQELTLPPVDQGNAATVNDNYRFFSQDVVADEDKKDACWNGVRADGKATNDCGLRELRLSSNSSLSLGGSIYSFCKLTLLSNTALYVAPGEKATIYFDSPENCKYPAGTTQLNLQSNARITSATGDPVSVALLFVGSETMQTRIQLNSNTSVNGPCDQNLVIYAPRTDVDLDSNSRFCGAIAGRSVHLDANAHIWSSADSDSFELPGVEIPETAAHYTPYRFVECSVAAAEPPDAGC
jgi:hypothetical protein